MNFRNYETLFFVLLNVKIQVLVTSGKSISRGMHVQLETNIQLDYLSLQHMNSSFYQQPNQQLVDHYKSSLWSMAPLHFLNTRRRVFDCCKQSLNRLYHSSIHPSIHPFTLPAPDFWAQKITYADFTHFFTLTSLIHM